MLNTGICGNGLKESPEQVRLVQFLIFSVIVVAFQVSHHSLASNHVVTEAV